MFYEPEKNNHGLRFNPFKSIVVPRPIGWITTLNLDGKVNLAPYSQFQNIGFDPPYVMFAASTERDKHSASNAMDTGEFVTNMATYDLLEAVQITAQPVPAGVDEAELAKLELAPSRLVKPPRVARSPVHMECKYYCSMNLPGRLPGQSDTVVVGKVVGIHIKDEFITTTGKIDIEKIRPLTRMGYLDYAVIDKVFEVPPIGLGAEDRARRMEGQGKE
jgi:flavin reductase (DIM6/NTAB) family NADH-FMN oxidoreductase RutF